MTMSMASLTQRSGVENINHIHRFTGRVGIDKDAYAINFVLITIGCYIS